MGTCMICIYKRKNVIDEVVVCKQTPSDVYCRHCHDVGKYFRMTQETFFDNLKWNHDSIISAPVKCNNLNDLKKHVSKHKETKHKSSSINSS